MTDDVLDTLAKLPFMCATLHPATKEPILLKRGALGFWPAPRIDVDRFNSLHGVTAAQRLAMEIGSIFGWDAPGADPDNHA